MRYLIVVVFVVLGFYWGERSLYAKDLVFDNGVEVDLPIYKNKQINPDGSVCVDMIRLSVTATICMYGKTTDDVVLNNGFIKYKNLSPGSVRQVPLLPDDAFVYAEGGYSFLYPARKKRVGDFIAYEADHVLCKYDSDDGDRPAICYAAALVPVKSPNVNPVFFVSAIIEQPPTPGEKPSKKAVSRVREINAIIKSIKIGK